MKQTLTRMATCFGEQAFQALDTMGKTEIG